MYIMYSNITVRRVFAQKHLCDRGPRLTNPDTPKHPLRTLVSRSAFPYLTLSGFFKFDPLLSARHLHGKKDFWDWAICLVGFCI